MSLIKLACWNVNGLRSIARKGFFDWLQAERPHIACLQETKISSDQLTCDLTAPRGYRSYFSHAEKRGYSGVALYTREEPRSVSHGFGIPRFDLEGRVLVAEYPDFTLLNIYYPNGSASDERLKYKLEFYEAFLDFACRLRKEGRRLIVCGDFNCAHKAIDLARPKANEGVSGFLPEERAWMDAFVSKGFVDTFRQFNREPHNYTWWHQVTRARQRNVGWRIDYFFVADDLTGCLEGASIESQVMGSDHCPITLRLRL